MFWSRTLSRSVALAIGGFIAVGSLAQAADVQTVFLIAMENHNWTQPGTVTSPAQIKGNPAAPFINSLITQGNPNAAQVSWTNNYRNTGVGIHPSEPNYIWAEAGSNLGILNDNDPFPGNNQTTTLSLSNLLQSAGKQWRSYQEDTDVSLTTNTVLPTNQWTVPLKSFSGSFTAGVNGYNGSKQYNYAAKHNPMVFFSTTNGGNDPTPSNPLAANYAPLQQLANDLASNAVAGRYNWITPDQYNDMHSALTGGFTYNGVAYTGDQSAIAVGDNFLSIIVPQIMASAAYKNNGAIIIWFDETENGDSSGFTIPEIVISPLAKGNAYNNTIIYTHSSDLLTMEEIFGVNPCVRDACAAYDLADLFKPGSIPTGGPVFVSDASRVEQFTTSGAFFNQFVINGAGRFPNGVGGLAFDAAGDFFVTDIGNKNVSEFDRSGSFLRTFGSYGSGNGQFVNGIAGIAVNQSGNVFVVDGGDNRVEQFSNTGVYLSQFGALGKGNGQFQSAGAIAIDAAGNIWVTDGGRVEEFSSAGTYLFQFPINGSGRFPNGAAGLAIDANGNIFITDIGGKNVSVFSSTGTLLRSFGGYGSSNGQFLNGIGGIAISPDAAVWVADGGNYRVQLFQNNGAFRSVVGSNGHGNGQFESPFAIAIGPLTN